MKALIVCTSLVMSVTAIAAQNLSRDQINEAIEQGRAGKTAMKKCGASGSNGFEIVVEGPIGRIMRAALDAKRHHREFTAESASDLAGPWLTVVARRDLTLSTDVDPMPPKPGSATSQDPAAEQLYSTSRMPRNASGNYTYATDVALRTKASKSAPSVTLQPAHPLAYSSVSPKPGTDMIASFDLAAFQALPAGDVSVVIFTSDAGERRCTISEKDRRALR